MAGAHAPAIPQFELVKYFQAKLNNAWIEGVLFDQTFRGDARTRVSKLDRVQDVEDSARNSILPSHPIEESS